MEDKIEISLSLIRAIMTLVGFVLIVTKIRCKKLMKRSFIILLLSAAIVFITLYLGVGKNSIFYYNTHLICWSMIGGVNLNYCLEESVKNDREQ